MPVQTSIQEFKKDLSVIYETYSGNVISSDITHSLVQSVVKTATNQVNFILSNWLAVTSAEFSKTDILSAVEGAFSVDLVSQKMYIAFIIDNNPHLEELASFFKSRVNTDVIHIKVFQDDRGAIEWFLTVK